jgi:hypothetical protein
MVANIRCKSHDYYSERNWYPLAVCVEQAIRQVRSRSRERGRVKLTRTTSISLCRAIKIHNKEVCNRKYQRPQQAYCVLLVKHIYAWIYLWYHWWVSQHSKIKKFLRMRTRKPRSNLGDVINERDRWDLHTLEEIAQRKHSIEHGWCSRTSRLLLVIQSDPTPQVVTSPRDAHVQRTNDSAFPVQRDMVEW